MSGKLPGLGGDDPPIVHVHEDMDGKAGDISRIVKGVAGRELYRATERFSKKTKISGISFVILGVRLWWEELAEINPVSTADYFRALADLIEAPTHEAKLNAEGRRRDAVERLIHGVRHIIEKEKGG